MEKIMNENYLDIDELILAFLNEKITLEEKNNLQHWIGTNSSNLQYFQQIYKIWMATQPLKMGENDVENVLTKLKFILNKADDSKQNMPKLTKNKYFEFLKWAAVIFLSIICGIVLTFIIG